MKKADEGHKGHIKGQRVIESKNLQFFFAFLGSLAVVDCLFSIFFRFEAIEAKKATLVARAAFLQIWNFMFPKLLL